LREHENGGQAPDPQLSWCVLVACALLASTASLAQPEEATIEEPSPWTFNARGYLLTRAQAYATDTTALLYPIVEIEPLRLQHEVDVELSAQGPGLYAYADVAGLLRIVPRGCGGDDEENVGCLILNEAYVEGRPVDAVRLLAGRHRPRWGRALTVQYSEALAPAPDVTDPMSQRLGYWMALGEFALSLGATDTTTLSAMVAPEVVHNAIGVPVGVDALYGHAVVRAAHASDGWDASLAGYWDYGEGKLLGAASGSAILFEQLVVHGQLLVHERRVLETGGLRQGSCPGIGDIGIPHRPVLDASANAGAYWAFDDGSLVGAEYLRNADGMETPDVITTFTTVSLIKQLCPNARIAPADIAKLGRPPPLSNTLLARNYVAVTALTPSIADVAQLEDMSLVGTLVVGLDDLSAIASARVAYTYAQVTTFRLAALVPLGLGPNQFTVLPFDASLVGEIQVSF
jgi:hypothetical protein